MDIAVKHQADVPDARVLLAAKKYALPQALLESMLKVESQGVNTACLRSRDTEFGPLQVLMLKSKFETWFKGSQVTANGAPLVVYHGTATKFSAFDGGRGVYYFTDDFAAAEHFAKDAYGDDDPIVLKVYLQLRNPLILDHQWYEENILDDGEPDWQIMDNVLYKAQDAGHDGAILRDMPDYFGMVDGQRVERPYTQFVVFLPEQIKSVENCGTFDPANPGIYV